MDWIALFGLPANMVPVASMYAPGAKMQYTPCAIFASPWTTSRIRAILARSDGMTDQWVSSDFATAL